MLRLTNNGLLLPDREPHDGGGVQGALRVIGLTQNYPGSTFRVFRLVASINCCDLFTQTRHLYFPSVDNPTVHVVESFSINETSGFFI